MNSFITKILIYFFLFSLQLLNANNQEKVLTKEQTLLINEYNEKSIFYYNNRVYNETLKYYEKILEIQKEAYGKENIDIAKSYNNIGLLYSQMNNLPKALEYLKKALHIQESLSDPNNIEIASTYNNIGSFYHKIFDYQKALYYYEKALGIEEKFLGNNSIKITSSYNNIGLLYSKMNYPQKALIYLEKALKIREKLLGENDADTADSYNSISLLYYKVGNYEKALIYLEKALSIQEKVLGADHIRTAKLYTNIATLYSKTNDYQNALIYFEKALKIQEDILGEENQNTINLYNNLGALYSKMNDYQEAYKFVNKSFNNFLKNRDNTFVILDSKQKLQFLKANSDKLNSLFQSSIIYQDLLLKNGKIDEATKIKEETFNNWLNYKGVVFDSENFFSILNEKLKDEKLKQKIVELNNYKQQLSKLYQSIPKVEEKDSYIKNIKNLEKNISENEIYLSSKIEEFKEKLGTSDIKVQDISSKLKNDEVFIDFAKTKDNYFVFTLDNKNNIIFLRIENSSTMKIDNYIKQFRGNIHTILKSRNLSKNELDDLTYSSKKVLSKLYDEIIGTLMDSSNIDTKDTLIFSLDGILNLLPFEALYDNIENKYLIEKKNIKYIPSGKEFVRLLRKNYKKSDKSHEIVMFTNPDYGATATVKSEQIIRSFSEDSNLLYKSLFSMIFRSLPGTKKEAELISKIYDDVKNYNQKDATSENLFMLNSPQILHISTHGFFLNDDNIKNPMLKSGLAFANANLARTKGDSQGVVTGLKLAGLDLKNTDLVVLSACETGLGDINEAEGVTGLNKAFIKAGAKNIVMSLWNVADKETIQLMDGFYSNIKNTGDYQKGLKESKIKMIQEGLHPFYWAAFIMSGI